jgi:hypothetical protein
MAFSITSFTTTVGPSFEQPGQRVAFDVAPGGIALWVKAIGVDVDAWARSAREKGTIVVTAAEYALDGRPRPYLRLGFGHSAAGSFKKAFAGWRLRSRAPTDRVSSGPVPLTSLRTSAAGSTSSTSDRRVTRYHATPVANRSAERDSSTTIHVMQTTPVPAPCSRMRRILNAFGFLCK